MAKSKTYEVKVREILENPATAEKDIHILYDEMTFTESERMRNAKENNQSSTKHSQGEHVINRSILKLPDKIVDEFLCATFPQKCGEIRKEIAYGLFGTNSLPEKVKNDIEAMTADFHDKEFYYDSNTDVYRVFITLLRKSAVQYMLHLYDQSEESHRYELILKKTCNMMNTNKIYVDKLAWNKYTNSNKNRRIYEDAAVKVEQMLDNLMKDIPEWINKILYIANMV